MYIVSKIRIDVYRTSLLFIDAIYSLTDIEEEEEGKRNLHSRKQQSDHLSPLFISVCQLVNIEHGDRHTSSMLAVCNLSHVNLENKTNQFLIHMFIDELKKYSLSGKKKKKK
jgi:hypothetical protein